MTFLRCFLLGLFLAVAACGGEGPGLEIDRAKAWETLDLGMTEEEFDAKLPLLADVPIDPLPVVGKNYHPVFPDPIPFDPSEWTTNEQPESVADPNAIPGGILRAATSEWPATVRTDGPNSRMAFLSYMHSLIYEVLLGYDYVTQEYVPALATHWRILPDNMTFQFRIDPRARWADGTEVTADDVVATVEHMQNPDRKDPGLARRWTEQVEYAKVLDKYTVEIKGTKPLWRNFMTIAWSMPIYPAAYIRMDGATYIKDWNWKLPPGTGPYELRPDDIRKGRSITVRRRKDWWQRDFPENRGYFNFDAIRWIVVRESELTYQKFLAGELDYYMVGRAQRWVEELEHERDIRMGWVQRRRVFNKEARGYGGFCINMRKAPYDDRRVRLAFAHLWNREKVFDKITFHQYEYTDSYFPGSRYARENAERIRYDPEEARRLLAEAGWVRKDDEGYLVNEKGERFPEIVFETDVRSWQRIYDIFVSALWNEAGIKMSIKIVNSATLSKKMWEYKFSLFHISWTASNFPAPEFSWHSKMADVPRSNNLPGFKDEEVDRLIDEYKTEFDGKKRDKMLQRMDEIFFDAHPYVLNWYGPYFRILYWDRFGHPPEYASRYNPRWINVIYYWWYDPVKAERLERNKRAGVPNYPEADNGQYDEIDQRYWLYNELPMKDE